MDGVWKEITQEQTRETAYRIGAGMMSLGAKKGDKVSLLSESRAMWILSELGALYAGMTDVPLSVNLGAGEDLIFRIGSPPDAHGRHHQGELRRDSGGGGRDGAEGRGEDHR